MREITNFTGDRGVVRKENVSDHRKLEVCEGQLVKPADLNL